jgi:hypothetical protein
MVRVNNPAAKQCLANIVEILPVESGKNAQAKNFES